MWALTMLLAASACHAPTPHETPVTVIPTPPRPAPVDAVLAPDTILVAGQPFRIGTRVVLFSEPEGYNAYQLPYPYGPRIDRFSNGRPDPSPERSKQIAEHGYTLPQLQLVVDRIVYHYDACGYSALCFDVLQHQRGLSTHFMVDVDGTIYQTLDLQERAWHAWESNSRSIGIEIANVGAYPPALAQEAYKPWYTDPDGGMPALRLPPDANLCRPGVTLHPARPRPVPGAIHGEALVMFDLTDAQYDALIALTAGLCRAFPLIPCQAPTDARGEVTTGLLDPSAMTEFRGLVGHYHLTEQKIDPGPAFDWQRLLDGTRRRLRSPPASTP